MHIEMCTITRQKFINKSYEKLGVCHFSNGLPDSLRFCRLWGTAADAKTRPKLQLHLKNIPMSHCLHCSNCTHQDFN